MAVWRDMGRHLCLGRRNSLLGSDAGSPTLAPLAPAAGVAAEAAGAALDAVAALAGLPGSAPLAGSAACAVARPKPSIKLIKILCMVSP